jgi:hypothetical protein
MERCPALLVAKKENSGETGKTVAGKIASQAF